MSTLCCRLHKVGLPAYAADMAFRDPNDAIDPRYRHALPPFDVEAIRGRATVNDALVAKIPVGTYYRWKRDECDLPVARFLRLVKAMKLTLCAVDPKQLRMLEVRRDDPTSRAFTRYD